jgi:hypothetical protein
MSIRFRRELAGDSGTHYVVESRDTGRKLCSVWSWRGSDGVRYWSAADGRGRTYEGARTRRDAVHEVLKAVWSEEESK